MDRKYREVEAGWDYWEIGYNVAKSSTKMKERVALNMWRPRRKGEERDERVGRRKKGKGV